MAKDEARYLEEFLAYHIIKGVDYFYIYYDKNSNDIELLKSIIKPYIKLNKVKLELCETGGYQAYIYNDCKKKYVNDNTWIAFIDADELINCEGDIKNELKKIDNENKSLCYINSIHFNHNGKLKYENELQIKRFPKHQAYINSFKCVINVKKTSSRRI